MIAFNHNITAPFLNTDLNKSEIFPSLEILSVKQQIPRLNCVRMFNQNQGREVSLSTTLNFDENVQDQGWVFTVSDIISFSWTRGSSIIKYYEDTKGNEALSQYWFLHTLLPIFFTIEDKFELIHAGSVEIDNKPVLFIAPSYGGKSTLTDYFIQQGHVMVSDDRVGLQIKDQTIEAISSYPYHRPYRKMEDLGIEVSKFMTIRKDLHLIYSLKSVDPKAEISFEKLSGLDTFKALQYNFDFTLPLNKARSFELIAKIASNIEIYILSIPWDLHRLPDVYQAVCEHSKQRAKEKC